MALTGPAMAAIAEACIAESLQLMADEARATLQFWECVEAVRRGEMTEELVWSDEGDLSFVFHPVKKP